VSTLARIVERVRERLEERRRAFPEERIRAEAERAPAPPGFRAVLEAAGTSLIAEVKRRSPSRPEGFLSGASFDAVKLAAEYAAAGARAVSVLTEPDFFGGSPDDLRDVRRSSPLPVLRKDFVVDPYQCWEARAWGASAALLIVASLDDARLRDLHELLRELSLDALVEVHTEAEAERALRLGPPLLGVNNRDLSTFTTDLGTTRRVAALVPAGTLLVSESGIFTREHVLEAEAAGARAVLVGEALLASGDPGRKVRELLGAGSGAAA
jgi:indole-3-glycerol phosphate synthase